MKILALIPARAGSKGLPRKNVLPLAGKPLIAWTIEAALASGVFGKVCVSTDGEEIAAAARHAGAELPFMRPAELASDSATTLAVVQHALAHYDQAGERFDVVVVLQPTSPLRSATHIREALALAKGQALISVTAFEHPIQWALSRDQAGALTPHPDLRAPESKRRQDLLPALRPNGAIYLWPRTFIEAGVGGLPKPCLAYEMSAESSLDIDSELDFKICQALIEER